MENLLEETKESIKISGHKIEDIIFIGSEATGHECTWKEYEAMADQEYDDGYGGQEVAADLIFVFSDGAKMWRDEYDGAEWWEFQKPFEQPKRKKPIHNLIYKEFGGWQSLEDLNEEKVEES